MFYYFQFAFYLQNNVRVTGMKLSVLFFWIRNSFKILKLFLYFRANTVIYFSQNNLDVYISYCISILPLYAISQLHQIVRLLRMPLWSRKILKSSMRKDLSNNLGFRIIDLYIYNYYNVFPILKPWKYNIYPTFLAEIISQISILVKY